MAINLSIAENELVSLSIEAGEAAALSAGSTTVVSVNDYEELRNKPRIEGVELTGDKSFEELNLQRLTNTELENMLSL
jgi:hypothetical protein